MGSGNLSALGSGPQPGPRVEDPGDAKLREIGTLAREKDARVLADYLLTRNISTKLEPRAGAWAIWVHREERVPEARSVLVEFEKNPADPIYAAAAGSAQEIRKRSE